MTDIAFAATDVPLPAMNLTAFVRAPSPALQHGERSHIEREPIDFALALEQHSRYVQALKDAGAAIVTVPAAPELPDSVFVEDTALVLGSLAIISRPGAASRRPEIAAVVATLSRYCEVTEPPAGVYFDGGDILTVERRVYVGRGKRTNQAAIDYLTTILGAHNYDVVPVETFGCLHLKSGVTYLGADTVLIYPSWIPRAAFARHAQVEVHPQEAGACALTVGERLFMSSGYPRTARRVEAHGFKPRLLELSEFHRAEGGLTCLSILMQDEPPA
jgi:dimethylargininase